MYPLSLCGNLATRINFKSLDNVLCVASTPSSLNRYNNSSCEQICSLSISFRITNRRFVLFLIRFSVHAHKIKENILRNALSRQKFIFTINMLCHLDFIPYFCIKF